MTEWWFNTHTREVEEGKLSVAAYRLGPFGSPKEAARAEEIIAERARRWAEEDAEDD